jgi:CubicO group peptidase (beta-lactamase class C family)
MRRRIIATFLVVLSLMVASMPAPGKAATLKGCRSILAQYPKGVAKDVDGQKNVVAIGYKTPAINGAIYEANKGLDRYKDNTVCVVEANKRPVLPGLRAPAVTSANQAQVKGNSAVSKALATNLANLGGTCMVAMRDEKIIGEWYSGGRKAADTTIAFSSGKPLTAAVIGAAVRLGRLNIDQSVADFIPEFKNTAKAAITIRHLMTHTSGLEATQAGPAIIAHTLNSEALKLSLKNVPGSTYDYDSSQLALQLLVIVVERAVGEKFTTFTDKYVLRPAGMANTFYKTDLQNAAFIEIGDPWLAGGLRTTCRDLARLAQLFQSKGQWAGQRIFSTSFAELATSVQVSSPGYGFLFYTGANFSHGGLCGQVMAKMSSGVTYAMMSNSFLFTPSFFPEECTSERYSAVAAAAAAMASPLNS